MHFRTLFYAFCLVTAARAICLSYTVADTPLTSPPRFSLGPQSELSPPEEDSPSIQVSTTTFRDQYQAKQSALSRKERGYITGDVDRGSFQWVKFKPDPAERFDGNDIFVVGVSNYRIPWSHFEFLLCF